MKAAMLFLIFLPVAAVLFGLANHLERAKWGVLRFLGSISGMLAGGLTTFGLMYAAVFFFASGLLPDIHAL